MSFGDFCLCGCGTPVKNKWIHGHNQRGSNSNLWRGGNKLTKNGYKRVPSGDSTEQVYEHRKVVELKLGRELRVDEEVHHINGDKTDNRPENLVVYTKSQHRVLEKMDPTVLSRSCVTCGGQTITNKQGGFKWYKAGDNNYNCNRCYKSLRRRNVTVIW